MPLKLNPAANTFKNLDIEVRRQQVAEWVVSTYDEATARKKLALMLKTFYRQEPLGYGAHENSYIHVVCGDQRANDHKPME